MELHNEDVETAGHGINPCGHYTLVLSFYIIVS